MLVGVNLFDRIKHLGKNIAGRSAGPELDNAVVLRSVAYQPSDWL